MPFWINAIGGYTQLGIRVVILALAAMSLNFLLGYTGVLSFGHAAYFGLGAYGSGLTIKYLVPSTLAGMAVGVLASVVAAAMIGLVIVRSRGIYFAMLTIAFGQVFYFIAYRWNERDRRRRRAFRVASSADQISASPPWTSSAATRRFTTWCWHSSGSPSA